MNNIFSIPDDLWTLGAEAEQECAGPFAEIRRVEAARTQQTLKAFLDNGVSESHFAASTGYGYDDRGRDTLDAVFAQALGCEAALVRHHFVSGTHALTVALFGVLRPGDLLLSCAGKPYDTLDEVIGIAPGGSGSLKDFGIRYDVVPLLPDGALDLGEIRRRAPEAKVAYFQRSCGYADRPTLTPAQLDEAAAVVREVNPRAIVMVDNCYGEFTCDREPAADLLVGSLIKNPGGGIARTGGYIAGQRAYVDMCAQRLTCPGAGAEVGCSLDEKRGMYLGLFHAPQATANAVRTAVFAARLFERLGYDVKPDYRTPRADIIQKIVLGDADKLIRFVQGMQSGAPVDAFVTPEPWDMPGYQDPVIMAAGAFTLGSSIELSCDGPVRPPYVAFMQGGIVYEAAKVGVLMAAAAMQR